ncbi:MAG: ROK family protein [Anaerolineaceae bacterium]
MSVFIGLDIGGTKIMAAAADASGNIIRRSRKLTPFSLPEGLETLHEMIADAAAGQSIQGMGAAIGGPLDWKTGKVSPVHQPEWRDVPLKTIMIERWGCPFYVDVDTNVAALGEFTQRQNPAGSFLYLTLSTGMGGGLIKNGKLFRGSRGIHPEAAHQSIHWKCSHPERIQCECGAPDCLEALVSGNGIRRIYEKPPEALTPEEWEEVAWNLGQGLRNLAVLYAPEEISIGGGLAVGAEKWLFPRSVEVMKDHLRLVPAPAVHLSRLGYDTSLVGAIYIAINSLEE